MLLIFPFMSAQIITKVKLSNPSIELNIKWSCLKNVNWKKFTFSDCSNFQMMKSNETKVEEEICMNSNYYYSKVV